MFARLQRDWATQKIWKNCAYEIANPEFVIHQAQTRNMDSLSFLTSDAQNCNKNISLQLTCSNSKLLLTARFSWAGCTANG